MRAEDSPKSATPRHDSPPRLRRVRVDPQGRLFDLDSGELIQSPGLEPEVVLEGLAQTAAGRGRPLREIIAERRRADGL